MPFHRPKAVIPFSVRPRHRQNDRFPNCRHFSLSTGATGSRVPRTGLVQSHAAFMPRPSGQQSGHPPDSSKVNEFRLVSTSSCTFSTLHQRFACARLSKPHMTGSGPAFSTTFTTTALYRRSLRWFEARPRRPTSRGLPPSSMQVRTPIADGSSAISADLTAALENWTTARTLSSMPLDETAAVVIMSR
jgi:hypothetical protein